jgi:hypothetical protein
VAIVSTVGYAVADVRRIANPTAIEEAFEEIRQRHHGGESDDCNGLS